MTWLEFKMAHPDLVWYVGAALIVLLCVGLYVASKRLKTEPVTDPDILRANQDSAVVWIGGVAFLGIAGFIFWLFMGPSVASAATGTKEQLLLFVHNLLT